MKKNADALAPDSAPDLIGKVNAVRHLQDVIPHIAWPESEARLPMRFTATSSRKWLS